jgi:hypothetical protein
MSHKFPEQIRVEKKTSVHEDGAVAALMSDTGGESNKTADFLSFVRCMYDPQRQTACASSG